MTRFTYTVKVVNRDGSIRVATGTVSHSNNAYSHSRARIDVANEVAKSLSHGESFDPASIDIRYAR